MADFVEIERPVLAASGRGVRLTIAEHCAVALFNVDGQLFAVDDCCARCGTSLAEGALSGAILSCRGCDWRYDVRTGRVNDLPALRLDTFEVKIVASRILVATTASP